MIRNPNDIQEGAKKIRMLIAGYPGIGKSTLALSAPNPLHIDVDFGIDRIEPRYRKPYIQPQSYDEILGDLTPINLQDFDTLVFDTGGKLISLMSLWAIKKDPKYGQRDGSLSLKGYARLIDDLGEEELTRCIDYIDESAQMHGNKNKWRDWNLVIRKCSRERWGIRGGNGSRPSASGSAMDDLQQLHQMYASEESL